MDFIEGDTARVIRCEFAAGDSVSDDNEAYLVSSAFTPQVSFLFVVAYNISSLDTAVELMILSRFTEQVIQRHPLSQQRSYFFAFLPITVEPIYVVLHAYTGVSTPSSSSAVTIYAAVLVSRQESQSLILLSYCSNYICI